MYIVAHKKLELSIPQSNRKRTYAKQAGTDLEFSLHEYAYKNVIGDFPFSGCSFHFYVFPKILNIPASHQVDLQAPHLVRDASVPLFLQRISHIPL